MKKFCSPITALCSPLYAHTTKFSVGQGRTRGACGDSGERGKRGAGLGGLDRTRWMGTGLRKRGRGTGRRTGYISGGTTYLPHFTPCGSPVGPPLKESMGHATLGGVWGPYLGAFSSLLGKYSRVL